MRCFCVHTTNVMWSYASQTTSEGRLSDQIIMRLHDRRDSCIPGCLDVNARCELGLCTSGPSHGYKLSNLGPGLNMLWYVLFPTNYLVGTGENLIHFENLLRYSCLNNASGSSVSLFQD